MTIAKEYLGPFNHDEKKFLNCMHLNCPHQVVAFWDSHGKILTCFMPKSQTVAARYY